MRYSFWIGNRGRTLFQQELELPDAGAARLEALQFAANVLRDSESGGLELGNLTAEVRATDGKLRVAIQISRFDEPEREFAEDEMAQEGEGHPS